MDMTFLEALIAWQQQGDRSISIEIGKPGEKDKVQVWVFDYSLMAGDHISDHNSLNGLDLAADKRKRLEEELARLEAK